MSKKELYPVSVIKAQERLCPRCKVRTYTPYGGDIEYVDGISSPFPALSRRDNKTYICSECGTREAFEDMGALPKSCGVVYWEVDK